MNYYYRYPGDYSKDTQDLSLAEHGAYTLLLDYLYGTQQVLPKNPVGLFRVTRAFTQDEQDAVLRVLKRFFVETEDGYTNERYEKESIKLRARIEAAQANGAKGGRKKIKPSNEPDKNPVGSQSVTQPEPSGLPSGQAIQSPITNIDKEENKNICQHKADVKKNPYPPEFEALWSVYPSRPNENKARAFRAYQARLREKIDHDLMFQGVIRYANYCRKTNKSGEYIKLCATFLGKDHDFLSDWIASPTDTNTPRFQSKADQGAQWLSVATGGMSHVQDRQQSIIDITPTGEYTD